MIRRATSDDIAPIMALARKLHATIGNLPPIDEQGCRMLLAQALCNKRRLLLVAERDGVVTGFMFGLIEEYFFSKSHYASDVILHSTDGISAAYLVRKFVRWAESMGVTNIQLGVSSGIAIDRADALYRRLGLTRVGSLYSRSSTK